MTGKGLRALDSSVDPLQAISIKASRKGKKRDPIDGASFGGSSSLGSKARKNCGRSCHAESNLPL